MPQVINDPITILATSLRAGEAPPIAWAVEWLDSDGTFLRAWDETTDLTAMRFILGSPYAGAIRTSGSLALLRGTASFVLSEEILLQLACGVAAGIVVGGMSRAMRMVGLEKSGLSIRLRVMLWTSKAAWSCGDLSRRERLKVVDYLCEETEPPMLTELLRRFKIGAYATEGQ